MITFWNLPPTATREIRERDQERVMALDDRVRIVRNRARESWQLVRRCAPHQSYVCLDGTYRTPGWWPFGEWGGERYSIEQMIEHMRVTDSWARHANKKESIRKFVDDSVNSMDRQLEREKNEAMEQAAGSAADRFAQLGRYFGPREAHTR